MVVGHGRVEAFRWTESGGTQKLGVLPGFERSAATAVSDDGEIVIGLSYNGFLDRFAPGGDFRFEPTTARAFYWTEEAGMQDLTQLLVDGGADLDGVTINAAMGMSGDGLWMHGITTEPDEEFPELFFDEVPVLMSLAVTPPENLPGDYNASGLVEQADLDLVLLNWGDPVAGLPATGRTSAHHRHRRPGRARRRAAQLGQLRGRWSGVHCRRARTSDLLLAHSHDGVDAPPERAARNPNAHSLGTSRCSL